MTVRTMALSQECVLDGFGPARDQSSWNGVRIIKTGRDVIREVNRGPNNIVR